jgi:hypothetical protein
MSPLVRPEETEYAEYYGGYVSLVPDGDVADTLRAQLAETLVLLEDVTPELETYRYAEGKWSLREVVGHLVDTERVFAYRALAMARSSDVELPGMDQDEWVRTSNAGSRALSDLTKEWMSVRRASVHLFASMDAAMGQMTGRASGYEFSVRSFPWIIAGHELWHRTLIARDYLGRGS